MMEQDAEQACGARHARSDGRRVRSPLGRLQCEQASCGVMSSRLEWAFVAQMKGQMVAVDQAANIGVTPVRTRFHYLVEAHAGRCGRQSRRC